MKCFCVPISRPALHSTKAEQAEERLFAEPIFPTLGSEYIEQGFAFAPGDVSAERNEDVWLAEVSVPLRYFVLQNEVLAERVPSQVGHDSMILVPVVARVGKDDIRPKLTRESFERILDGIEMGGEIAISELVQPNRTLRCRAEELTCSSLRLARARACCAPYHPSEFRLRDSLCELR